MDGNINTLFNSLATTIRNVSVAIGVFAFMWGAIQYATSGGSAHQAESGKSAMKASLIGVAAVVLAATLVGIVFNALGGTTGTGAVTLGDSAGGANNASLLVGTTTNYANAITLASNRRP